MLIEAALLGVIGAVVGLGLGVGLALALIELMRSIGFPVGDLVSPRWRPIAAIATGLLTAVLRRSAPRPPGGADLADPGGARDRGAAAPAARAPRAILGLVLIGRGLAGAFWLGAADETTTLVAAAGMAGTIAIFFGIAHGRAVRDPPAGAGSLLAAAARLPGRRAASPPTRRARTRGARRRPRRR